MTTTSEKTQHIDQLHFEHQLWTSELLFYKDELKIYRKYLEEIAMKNTGREIAAEIEHFQNQFIIQKEELDKLKHNIQLHEDWLNNYAVKHPVAVDHASFPDHKNMREEMESYKKLYAELKVEFMRFLADKM